MRSPSPRVLTNRCDIYPCTVVQDPSGGPQFTYPDGPSQRGVACSAQPVETTEVLAEQDRLIRETKWKVLFAATTRTRNRDKLVITDPAGVQHTAFVHIEQDQAGRGAAYVVYAIERV
jgi:hypothetical protein